MPAASQSPPSQRLRVAESAPPAFSVYTSRDGLSDEIWSTVGFDADGFVWGGSASSLARFDGYRWAPPPRLPQARSLVRDMQVDDEGTLWAIFEREGIARYDGKTWALAGESRFFQRFSVIRSGAGREIWAAANDGFLRLRDGLWQEDPGNDVARTGRPLALARTARLFGEAREWMGAETNGMWYRVPSGLWQRFDRPEFDGVRITDVRASEIDGSEELWVTTYGGGLMRIRDEGIRRWRADTGELPSEALYSIVETRNASGERLLWVASRAGLLRIRGETIDVFDRRHGLPSDAVRSVKVQDDNGTQRLWLATEGGLVRATLADSPWQTVSLIGARENGVFGVLLEPDGSGGERLWVGSAREGLGMLHEGKWRYFTRTEAGDPLLDIRGIWRLPMPDGGDRRVLGRVGAGLLEIDEGFRIVPFATPWPPRPEESAATAIARTHRGAVEWWIGTLQSGVYRWRDGVWTRFVPEGVTLPWTVLDIDEQIDAHGTSWLWAAGPQGLARFDGDAWQMVENVPGMVPDGFRGATPISDRVPQELWAASNRNGVIRLDVGDPLHPRRIDGDGMPPPPDPTIYSVLRDSHGRVYVCTNNGVQQLTLRPDGGFDERVFRRRDGLVHDECNTGSQFVDATDRYWVGTLGGLSVFDPDVQAVVAAPVARPLHFTALRIDGVERPFPEDAPLPLPAGVLDLHVEYALLTGLRENETLYRSQLLGHEPAPTRWTAEHGRNFSGLSPGHYALRIDARDYLDVAAKPRTFEFSIAPHWWQRTALQALVAALVLATGFVVVMMYNRGLRARQRELRREVSVRTAELRGANERLTELSYLDPLTGVANRRRLMEAIAPAIERANAQQRPIGLIVADVDHFKDYNDRHGHLAGDVALRAIALALQSVTREQDLVARFGGEEFACLMIDADLPTVARVAERMRALVEALPPRSLGNDTQTVTLSAGILSRVPAALERSEDLLSAADAALYEAKKAGRNRVVQARIVP